MNQNSYFGNPKPTHLLLAGSLLLLSPGLTLANDSDWVTDRPDQTEGATVVGIGRTQLETGLIFSEGDSPGGDRKTTEIGGTLVRVGLWERVELRFIWDGWISERSAGVGADADGIGNSHVGAKWSLAHEEGKQPEIALLGSISIPTGDDQVASDRMDPAFRFSFSNTLSDTISIGYNAGLAWESTMDAGGERDQLSNYEYTLVLGTAHSERLGSFVEFFGEAPASANGSPANSINGGVTYRIRHHVQLDLSTGIGLSDAADDWFIASGVSILFD